MSDRYTSWKEAREQARWIRHKILALPERLVKVFREYPKASTSVIAVVLIYNIGFYLAIRKIALSSSAYNSDEIVLAIVAQACLLGIAFLKYPKAPAILFPILLLYNVEFNFILKRISIVGPGYDFGSLAATIVTQSCFVLLWCLYFFFMLPNGTSPDISS
jgi:hypothetical protein